MFPLDNLKPDRRRRQVRHGMALALALMLGAVAVQAQENRRGRRQAEPPKLEILVNDVDLGKLAKGQSAEAVFRLRNSGEGRLRIKSVEPGCGCTIATYDNVIPPGEEGEIRAVLDTTEQHGTIAKPITVRTNDRDKPAISLIVRAEVTTAVRIIPDQRMLIRNYEKTRVQRVVRSLGTASGVLYMTGLKSTEPWLSVRGTKIRENQQATDELPALYIGDWVVEVTLDPEAPYGRQRAEVRFSTGLEEQPEVRMEVLAEVRPPVELPIESFTLAPVDGGAEQTLPLSLRPDVSVDALVVDSNPAGLETRIRPTAAGDAYQAQVRWSGGALDEGTVTFRFGDEAVTLPVRTAVR